MMKKTASYGLVLILLLIGLLFLDFYFGSSEAGEKFWETDWFKWRMAMFGILILGIAAYFWINKMLDFRRRQAEFSRKLMAAREAERRMLAAELHDDLQQDLHAVKLTIDRIRTASSNGNGEKLQELSETLNESIEKVRILSHSLFPSQLEKLGLKTSIEKLFMDAAALTGMQLNLKLDEINDPFRMEASIQIYRIIQEILNNIIKHSKATRIDAEVTLDNVFFKILVADNGKGISDYDPKFKTKGSFGLATIYERVKLLKGTMDIKTSRNLGTKVIIYIPVKHNPNLYE